MILGSYGLKNLKRKRKASGLKRERLEGSNPFETLSFSLLKKAIT